MSGAEGLADRIDGLMGIGGWRKDASFIVLSGVALVFSILGYRIGDFDPAWIAVIL